MTLEAAIHSLLQRGGEWHGLDDRQIKARFLTWANCGDLHRINGRPELGLVGLRHITAAVERAKTTTAAAPTQEDEPVPAVQAEERQRPTRRARTAEPVAEYEPGTGKLII